MDKENELKLFCTGFTDAWYGKDKSENYNEEEVIPYRDGQNKFMLDYMTDEGVEND